MTSQNINKDFSLKKRDHVSKLNIKDLLTGVKAGNLSSISRALTLVENQNISYSSQLLDFLSQLPDHHESLRIAISGPPGAGKSSFIEIIGNKLISLGHKIAVLAIDPSSEVNKGSILGDKTRMSKLSRNPKAFIRPSANMLDGGGIRKSTYDSIRICEAAGYDIIFIETVGVGQSELLASQITDLFCLLLTPAGGDELQGIKKGIVELADIIIINKADGALKSCAEQTQKEYASAIHYSTNLERILKQVEVLQVSALKDQGIDQIASKLSTLVKDESFQNKKKTKRTHQEQQWFVHQSMELIKYTISDNSAYQSLMNSLLAQITKKESGIYDQLEELKQVLSKNIKF